MNRAERIFVAVNKAIVGLLLAAVFLIIFTNVVMRYGFGTSLAWGEETARFLMIAGAYFGAGLALREGRLVAIEVFQDRLPPVLRRALRYGIAALMIVFMGLVVWFGIQFAQFGWNKETMATQISRGIPYAAIPLGAAVFVVHALLFIGRFVRGDFELEDYGEPSDEPSEASGAR